LAHPLVPRRPWRRGEPALAIEGARLHNLKHIDAAIPLARLVCVTGVSGSGKSTLVRGVLHDNLRRLIAARGKARLEGCTALRGAERVKHVLEVDQTPI